MDAGRKNPKSGSTRLECGDAAFFGGEKRRDLPQQKTERARWPSPFCPVHVVMV